MPCRFFGSLATHRSLPQPQKLMTSFANPAVYQCPACQGLLLRERLRSFNTFGVTSWSDGDATFSRLPSRSPLIRCPCCPAVFWQDDVQPIGELPKKPMRRESMGWFMRMLVRLGGDENGDIQTQRDWNAAPTEWRAAEYDEELEYGDLCLALSGLRSPDHPREKFIRRRIWWLTNDCGRIYRNGKCAAEHPLVPPTAARENMLRLLELNEQEGGSLVERAELLRQMERFDDAVQLSPCVPPVPI
ncbi:hypothetical protein RCH08_000895 [Janthinobacterium sp. CG_S6]|nr:hypothetical protein [Janthinobacterium sp. CG_S6]